MTHLRSLNTTGNPVLVAWFSGVHASPTSVGGKRETGRWGVGDLSPFGSANFARVS